MYYIVETRKTFDQAVSDLETAVANGGFGVLHIHNLGETLRAKGVDFSEDCKVLEVCNPVQAGKVLSVDMKLNMALPCRISVYSEDGKVRIGLIKPAAMLSSLSDSSELAAIAAEVEVKLIAMLDAAR